MIISQAKHICANIHLHIQGTTARLLYDYGDLGHLWLPCKVISKHKNIYNVLGKVYHLPEDWEEVKELLFEKGIYVERRFV